MLGLALQNANVNKYRFNPLGASVAPNTGT